MSNPPDRPVKSMSSRLMTMKFMQRAASSAAAASSLPNRSSSTSSQNPSPSPSSSSPSSSRPPKRLKSSSSLAPNSFTASSFSAATRQLELQAIQEAVAAEEAKRSRALDQRAADAGLETKWVLSTGSDGGAMGGFDDMARFTQKREKVDEGGGLWVRRIGYSEIDNAGSEEDKGGVGGDYNALDEYGYPRDPMSVPSNIMGRRSFGKFNRVLEKQFKRTTGEQSSSSSDEAMGEAVEDDEDDEQEEGETDDSNDPTGANDLIRTSKKAAVDQFAKAARRADKKSRKAEAAMLAERRRSKEIKLNGLSSISGGGHSGAGGRSAAAAANPNVDCYNCGQHGHVRKNCPNFTRQHHTNGRAAVLAGVWGGAGAGAGGGKLKRKNGPRGDGGGGLGPSSTKRAKLSSFSSPPSS
ncbi:hypothetical protein MMC07_007938 [Pseudocyphellaria aurata]|nr:hypothetical protein [Pseudocyphellaria aurata]